MSFKFSNEATGHAVVERRNFIERRKHEQLRSLMSYESWSEYVLDIRKAPAEAVACG